MTGFEPGSSSIGSDSAANCATTTAQPSVSLLASRCENFFHLFFNRPFLASFLFIYSFFLTNLTIFQQHNVKNVLPVSGAWIRTRDLLNTSQPPLPPDLPYCSNEFVNFFVVFVCESFIFVLVSISLSQGFQQQRSYQRSFLAISRYIEQKDELFRLGDKMEARLCRVVASDTKDLQFESNHWDIFKQKIQLRSTVLKRWKQVNKKRA